MRFQILFVVLIGIGAIAIGGCSSETEKVSTAAEVKAFKGGPMPPAARKLFEESMRQSEKRRAEHMAQAQADAAAGKH